jgi:hypothetical protein
MKAAAADTDGMGNGDDKKPGEWVLDRAAGGVAGCYGKIREMLLLQSLENARDATTRD